MVPVIRDVLAASSPSHGSRAGILGGIEQRPKTLVVEALLLGHVHDGESAECRERELSLSRSRAASDRWSIDLARRYYQLKGVDLNCPPHLYVILLLVLDTLK